MIFTETKLSGTYFIEIEKCKDERGFFARTWDKKEFIDLGLDSNFVQSSISVSKKKGTLRGLHYQSAPYEESKIIRCVRGKIYDVFIDLRPHAKTFKKWFSIELNEDNYRMVYLPKGFAHGFQTLEDNTTVFYQISEFYNPKFSKGIIWNDAELNISWPLKVTAISEKDKSFPSLKSCGIS